MIRTYLVTMCFLILVGCSGSSTTGEKILSSGGSDVPANLAKLEPADREIAEAQKKCPVGDEPLGSMGVPVKLTLKGQAVFLCCKSCEKKAVSDVDATLEKVSAMKKQ